MTEERLIEYLKCICCEVSLEDLHRYQPNGGTAFHTTGHYGSAITDHMDGTVTTVFICDDCMAKALKAGIAKEARGK